MPINKSEIKKVLVTGATGFLGRNLVPVLEARYGKDRVVGVCSKDYDLLEPSQAKKMIAEINPDVIVHLAAYSGGIGANRKYPADFYFINTLLTANVFEAAGKAGNIKKLVYTMGGCSYPATATSPISEDQMWNGYPQEESAGYSAAKKMGIVAAKSYKQQYGLNATVLIPGNLYGEYDNYSLENSHVIPAMIRKFYEAKINKTNTLTFWGSGAPQRDFCYVKDVANVVPHFIENYDEVGPVNVSSGTTITIKTLAETVSKMVGFEGRLEWDTSKPDGQMIKIFDVTQLKAQGLACNTSLSDGLKATAAWYANAIESKDPTLRS